MLLNESIINKHYICVVILKISELNNATGCKHSHYNQSQAHMHDVLTSL